MKSVSLIIILFTFLLIACGPRPIGYGLVLWGEGEFETGQIVRIIKESQIQKAYLVQTSTSKDLAEVPFWRIRRFPDVAEAEGAVEGYQPYLGLYGYSERDGLPIREKAQQEAKRIYKLRAGQVVKILSRGSEKAVIANYEDYWYRVLTDDGYEGFCFGYFLPVFTTSGNPEEEAAHLMSQDPILDQILHALWRPEYFQDMINNGRIDIERFQPEFGFFIQPALKRVEVVLPKIRVGFDYEEIVEVGPNRYHFLGTDLRVQLLFGRRLVASFVRRGQLISQVFVPLEEELDELIETERQRRQELLEQFLRQGRVLHSSAYGDIRLDPAGDFLWNGFEQLLTHIDMGTQTSGDGIAGSGAVDFPYYLSPALKQQYDGTILFRFSDPDLEAGFVYLFDDAGVRFLFLRPEDVEDLEVVRLGISPLVIYFKFGSS